MAILSHGVDLVDVQRIEHMLESHGERFTDRVFTAGERSYADAGGQQRAERYAARFACKEAVFKVLGTGWGQGVSWSEVDVSRNADGKPGIEVTGRVPETPPFFDQASVAIAPLRMARGVQNKVLEALSMGTAVVTSSQAARGLGQTPDDVLQVADGADATTDAICDLLANPSRARAMGATAAAWVREHWRWDQVLHSFDVDSCCLGYDTTACACGPPSAAAARW